VDAQPLAVVGWATVVPLYRFGGGGGRGGADVDRYRGGACHVPAVRLDAFLVSLAGAIHNFRLYDRRDEQVLLSGAIVGVVASIGYLALFLWSRRFPFRDPRPTPRPVRLSYAVLVLALVPVGIALITTSPHMFPWALKPESSVFFDWVLLTSAL